MCIKIIKNIYYKNISVYKGCFLLFFLAVVMVVFMVAMMKLNLERIPNKNMYMPITENSWHFACLANPRVFI